MWAVVHFLDDNSVDYVPTSWIRKNRSTILCAWPNSDNNLKKFRTNRIYPNKLDFSFYKCRVISKDIELVSEAQEKTNRAQFTSDISDGNNSNRKQNKDKTYNSAVIKKSSWLSGSTTKMCENKILKISNTDIILQENDEFSENSSIIDDSDVDKDYIPNEYQEKQNNTSVVNMDYENNVNDSHMIGTSSKAESSVPKDQEVLNTSIGRYSYCDTPSQSSHPVVHSQPTSAVDSPSVTLGFQKATLNYLAFLKVEISKIADNQQQILEYLQSSNCNVKQGTGDMTWDHEVDYFIYNWPICNKENLISMEEKIKSDNNFQKQVVCELARIGGKSLKNMIYKIMKRVFDDKVLVAYTYYGLRSKENFSLLAINKAIFDAIKKSNFKSSSDDEIITAIGKWLTSSKGRLEKKDHCNY